jgi:hypothetical protein
MLRNTILYAIPLSCRHSVSHTPSCNHHGNIWWRIYTIRLSRCLSLLVISSFLAPNVFLRILFSEPSLPDYPSGRETGVGKLISPLSVSASYATRSSQDGINDGPLSIATSSIFWAQYESQEFRCFVSSLLLHILRLLVLDCAIACWQPGFSPSL